MICHPHLRDGITLSKDGMDGMHLYLMKKHLIRFVLNYSDPKTNTQEDIDASMKNLWIKITAKSRWSVSMEGQFTMTLVHAIYVGGMRTMNKKYTYTQIVKIVGHKVISKFDNGQITLGKFMEIFKQKLKEKN